MHLLSFVGAAAVLLAGANAVPQVNDAKVANTLTTTVIKTKTVDQTDKVCKRMCCSCIGIDHGVGYLNYHGDSHSHGRIHHYHHGHQDKDGELGCLSYCDACVQAFLCLIIF